MICGEQNKHLEFGKVGGGVRKKRKNEFNSGKDVLSIQNWGEGGNLLPVINSPPLLIKWNSRDTNRFQTWPNASGHDGNKVAMALWPYETNKHTSASNVFASFVLLTV